MSARTVLGIVGVVAVAVLGPLPASAQEDVEGLFNVSLDSLLNVQVVSVSRRLENALTAPGTVYVITGDEIDRYGFQLLQEALRYVPSVYLYDPHSWVWGGQRGLVSNFSQTLLQLNGREVNNLIAQEGFISRQFSTHNVDRIEVVASPGSALHGANALAGVVNIVTKDADPAYQGFEMDVEGGSFNTLGLSLLFGQQVDELSIKGSFRQFNSDEEDFLDFVRDTVNYSPGWVDNDLARPFLTRYENPSEATTLNLQVDRGGLYAGVNHYRNVQSHGLESRRWDYSGSRDFREFDLFYGGFSGSLSPSVNAKVDYQNVRSSLWGQYHAGFWPVSRLEAAGNADTFTFPETVVTSSGQVLHGESEIQSFYPSFAHYLVDQGLLDPGDVSADDISRYLTHIYSNKTSPSQRHRLDLMASWSASPEVSLDFGLSFDHIAYSGLAVTDAGQGLGASFDVPLDPGKRIDAYENVKHGAFAQLTAQLNDRIGLNAGARLDHQNHYGNTFNPRFGLVLQPDEATVVKALYGEAFREPNVFELTSDPQADPAKLRALELNVVRTFGDVARLTVAGYRNRVSNFLGSVGSLIGTGVGKVKEQGVAGSEVRLDLTRGSFIGFATGSFIFDTDQKLEDGGGGTTKVEVLGIPKTKLNLGGWQHLTDHLGASLIYSIVGSYDALSGNASIGTPFQIEAAHELHATLQVDAVEFGGAILDGFVKVNNLTDAKVYEANIRRSGPNKFLGDGRSLHLGLSLRR